MILRWNYRRTKARVAKICFERLVRKTDFRFWIESAHGLFRLYLGLRFSGWVLNPTRVLKLLASLPPSPSADFFYFYYPLLGVRGDFMGKKKTKDLAIELPEPEIISLDDELSSICQNYNECSDSSQIRCSAYMVYPESMDLNDIISKISVQAKDNISFLLSPLHDQDRFDNGELKKPHYHLMMIYSHDTNTTVARAKRWGQLMGLVGCEIVRSKKGYARYLCHLDSKNKVKYNVDDVKAFNIDYLALIGNLVNKFDIFRDLINFINENDILFYSDLVDWCKDNNDDWFRSLMGGATFTIEKYIRERRFKASYMDRDVVSPKGFQEFENDGVRMNHFIQDLSFVLKNYK